MRWGANLAALGALAIAAVPFLTLLGLGVHRGGAPWAVAGSATLLTFTPAVVAATVAPEPRRVPLGAGLLAAWSLVLFQVLLPVYFPGERTHGFRTGVGLLGGHAELPGDLAAQLPDEPELARPAAPDAPEVVEPDLPPPLDEEALAIPYEGDGRRMAVPVVFREGDRELEVVMMFDTGATYTTLASADLERLGIRVGPDAPTIELHTANGVRTADLVRVDEVWLGNLPVRNVTIATCESCASGTTAGLLGLNVSGGFNLQIDADRREVGFRPRARFDRQLDVKVFTALSATFERLPGGRVEVVASLENPTDVPIDSMVVQVACPEGEWTVDLGAVPPGESVSQRRALPPHPRCDGYDLSIHEATW